MLPSHCGNPSTVVRVCETERGSEAAFLRVCICALLRGPLRVLSGGLTCTMCVRANVRLRVSQTSVPVPTPAIPAGGLVVLSQSEHAAFSKETSYKLEHLCVCVSEPLHVL